MYFPLCIEAKFNTNVYCHFKTTPYENFVMYEGRFKSSWTASNAAVMQEEA